MRRLARTSTLLAVVALLVAGLAVTGLAAEEGAEEGVEGSTTTTTVATDSGLEPAVDLSEEPTEPPQPDWTYRYMIPTALVLAAVIVLVTAIRYFTDVVRKRYRIIEE